MNNISISRKLIHELAEEENFDIKSWLNAMEQEIQVEPKEKDSVVSEKIESEKAKEVIDNFDFENASANAHAVSQDDMEDFSDFFTGRVKSYLLTVEEEIANDREFIGEAFGVGDDETGYHYLVLKNESLEDNCSVPGLDKVALIVPSAILDAVTDGKVSVEGYDYLGAYDDNNWRFYRCADEMVFMATSTFSLTSSVFSRNEGIFETKEMLDKYAIIVGAGSVGSMVAMQLARSGVGTLMLIDNDVMKHHNVCRHQLGFKDLGRYKTKALKEAVLNINPKAKVIVYNGFLQNVPMNMFDLGENGIIIGTADNRYGDYVANILAEKLNIPFVSTGCWSRAAAGEVFYWIPGQNMPTYGETFAGLISEDDARPHPGYFENEEEAAELKSEPGTSVDISFVTDIALKVCLDLLNLNSETYTVRVLNYLKNITFICNTNDPTVGGEKVEVFPHPLFISDSIIARKKDEPNAECAETGRDTASVAAD